MELRTRQEAGDQPGEDLIITDFIDGGQLLCAVDDIEMQRGIAVVGGDEWILAEDKAVIDAREVA